MIETCLIISDDDNGAETLSLSLVNLRHRLSPICLSLTEFRHSAIDSNSAALVLIHGAEPPGTAVETIGEVRRRYPRAAIGVCLSTQAGPLRQRAYELGADEILDLPLDLPLCVQRIRTLYQRAQQNRLLHRLDMRLRARRESAWSEVLNLETEMLRRLSSLSAHNDMITHKHQQRSAQLAGRVALRLGLPAADAETIEQATGLHDIGKIGIPTGVLCKIGRFSIRDRQIMSQHPLIGHQLLADGATPVLRLGAQIALTHHERFDGSGYPHGLGGDDIPLPARIAAVADIYDSLTEQRRYNRTRSADIALAQLDRHARAGQLDRDCVQALRTVVGAN